MADDKSTIRYIFELILRLLEYLSLREKRRKDESDADRATDKINDDMNDVTNPEKPVDDPMGTGGWNDGK